MIFGIVVLISVLISHLPQYQKIIEKGTSDGIDHRYLFLSGIGASVAWNRGLFDITDDHQDRQEILKFLQLTFQLINLILFYVLFITFYNDNIKLEQGYTPVIKRKVFTWTCIATILNIVLICISVGAILTDNNWHKYYSEALGLIFLTTSILKYIPQIYLTYQTKFIGSISMKSLALQCLSMLLMPIFMSKNSDVITWTPYLIVCFVQFGYLIMLYHVKKEQRQYSLLDAI
jgi:archaellum biogenesis protein FlaJ (TadC family)